MANHTNYNLLLIQLQHQSLSAFDELFRVARKRLYVLAYSIVNDEEAAKDIVQEFFIDFWTNRRSDRIEQSLEHYMLYAVRNRSLKYLRSKASVVRKMQTLPHRSAEADPNRMEQEDLKKEMDKAIGNLPPMARKVFQLHYIEHLPHAQIAEQLGISKSTVSSHIDRALKELRVTLKNIENLI